ncbi:MAG: zinc ABC transporter substrate-binding protein [Treponema sp.]|nr:zinc ABC transporter substrate-binding protein [Treponema sp.]
MRKIMKLFVCVLLACASACAFAAKKSIVCVTYPEYDWVLNILGNRASAFSVTLLQKNGTDLHSYQPSAKDIAKLSTCNMLVYVGGESDEWVEKAVSNSKNKNMTVVNLIEVLGSRVLEEEIIEGMETGHRHEEGHHHEDDHDEDGEETEYDEHVWLSIKNAVVLTEHLSEKIQALDSANARVYKDNAASYIAQLSALDSEYEKTVASARKKTVLFGDRFPFRYLTDDYGLTYYAAFVGCSAESEASFETVLFLAKKVDELGLSSVLTIEKSDKKIAKTVVANTKNKNQDILEMDSLQSVTQKEINSGRTYLSAMKNNLEVLKKALR